MPLHRTFGTVAPSENGEEPAALEGPTFTLEGGPPVSPTVFSETFTCVPVAPAGVLDDLAACVRVDGRGRQIYDAPSLIRFMRGVLVDADEERFVDLCHDKTRIVQLEDLGNVVMWLSEAILGRPSTPLSS